MSQCTGLSVRGNGKSFESSCHNSSLCSFTENTYNWNPKTLQILKPNLNFSCKNTSNQTVHYLYFVSENIYASLLHIKFQLWFSPDQSLISLCAPGGQLVDHWRDHGGPLTGPLDRPWCTRDHSLDHWTTCLAVWQSRMTIVHTFRRFGCSSTQCVRSSERQVFVSIVEDCVCVHL